MVALLAIFLGFADPTPPAERGPQFAGCFTEVGDADRDGMSDACEAALLERWFEHGELRWVHDAPVVWVAEGKNGNYPSKAACDSGHWGYDTCDRNTTAYRFPVASARQNIGSFAHPFPHREERSDCIADPELLAPADGARTECIWTGATFRGWSDAPGPGATGYHRYLREVAGFVPTGTG